MVRLLALLAGLAIAVTGCSNAVAGTPVAGPMNNEPLTAKQVFGEFSTVNYCSLVDVHALPRELGEVQQGGAASFDFCTIVVQMKGATIEGQVGFLEDADSIADRGPTTEDHQRELPHGLKMHRGGESDEACLRFLQFPDDLWLTFIADTYLDETEPEGDWCPLADAMVDVAIGLIGSGKMRHFTWDEKSVARLDACDLIKPEVVASKLGMPRARLLRFPSGHECSWEDSSVDGPGASLTFAVRPVTDGLDATDETIAGRKTRIIPSLAVSDDSFSLCVLETEHIKSTAFGSNELVSLQTTLPGTNKDVCGPGKELAREIWANLPKP